MQECNELFSSIRKKLAETLGTVCSLLQEQGSGQGQSSHSNPLPSILKSVKSESEEKRESIPLSTLDSNEEEGEEEIRASRYKLTLEEVDDLLKVVYTTLDIQEEKAQLSLLDKISTGAGGV